MKGLYSATRSDGEARPNHISMWLQSALCLCNGLHGGKV